MPEPFKLERYFAEYEFKIQYSLGASDCESLHLRELVELADADGKSRWESLTLGYTETCGHAELREEISRLYQTANADDVLIVVPAEGIFIAMHTLLSAGDDVITLFPGFQALSEVASFIGCKVSRWPLRIQTDQWYLDLDELKKLITPRTRLLVLNFPNNPTGYQPSLFELDGILNVARHYGLYVFSDEIYRLLEYTADRRLPAVCDLYERGITLSGLSKAFGLPGLRVGWLVTRAPGIRKRWLTFKDYTTICNSAPSEILGLIALRAREIILQRNLQTIASNLDAADVLFAAHGSLFQWLRPSSGPVAFPRWKGPGPLEELLKALRARGVLMVPGSLFDFEEHFRVGLGRTNFQNALSILEKALPTGG